MYGPRREKTLHMSYPFGEGEGVELSQLNFRATVIGFQFIGSDTLSTYGVAASFAATACLPMDTEQHLGHPLPTDNEQFAVTGFLVYSARLSESWVSSLSRPPGKRVWDSVPTGIRIPLLNQSI